PWLSSISRSKSRWMKSKHFTMSYYKPATLFQKFIKLLQLYFYSFRLSFVRKTRIKNQKHTSVLMIVSKLDRIGGLERQALELSAALIHHGCLITIITDRMDDDDPAVELRSGYLIRRLTRSNKPIRLFFSMLWFLFRKRETFQIIHAHGVTGFTLASLRFCGFFDRPALLKGATKGDFGNIFNQNNLKHRLYQKWILSSNRLIAISGEMKEELLSCEVPKDRIINIPNGVHTEKFCPPSTAQKVSLRNRFSIDPDQVLFLYFGRLESRKGVDVLLNAWHLQSPGHLWIVGSGAEQKKLKKLTIDLNLQDIRFYDESVSSLEFYQCADVFVLPSLKEGMPGALLEAMSCGLPCIATKIGGVLDVMQNDKHGLLVPPGMPQELADALAFMESHPEKRFQWGKSARETVLHQFEISRIAADYNSLYGKILASRES
ncbi:MAG: glycosyltransferase family 4 protein, partial [Acidobacteriota bacterium]